MAEVRTGLEVMFTAFHGHRHMLSKLNACHMQQ